jgi:hypothetical protein
MTDEFQSNAVQSLVVEPLTSVVQGNCNLSDARHGADYSLCTYLMKMREYYRWEKGLPYAARLPKAALGDWLDERERLWESLGGDEFAPVPIGRQSFDPFDEEAINRVLEPAGLVYSAGLGRNAKPHFFLGQLERRERFEDFTVAVSGREYARDLSAPPAMSREGRVFVRRESLRRMLWEKLEVWRWSRPDNALGRAFACYDFDNDLDDSLERMTDRELSVAMMHEIGEVKAGQLLGTGWNEMLLGLAATPAELMARAVRDHLADCVSTLPRLAEDAREASVHFYIGNLNNMRKQIFPGLDQAYRSWLEHGDLSGIIRVAERGRHHWLRLAEQMLEFNERKGPDPRRLQALVERNYLYLQG